VRTHDSGIAASGPRRAARGRRTGFQGPDKIRENASVVRRGSAAAI